MADKLYGRVLNNEVDLMVGPVSPRRSELEFIHLFDDRYVAILPKNHPLAAKKSVVIKDLAKYPLLLLTSPTNVRIILEQAFDNANCLFMPVYEASNPSTIGGMIKAGLGITALPDMNMAIIKSAELVSVPITKPEIIRQNGIYKRPGEKMTPAALKFSETLTEIIEKQIGKKVSSN
jgi:LysR family carnitine catabolism transcriptional activator